MHSRSEHKFDKAQLRHARLVLKHELMARAVLVSTHNYPQHHCMNCRAEGSVNEVPDNLDDSSDLVCTHTMVQVTHFVHDAKLLSVSPTAIPSSTSRSRSGLIRTQANARLPSRWCKHA